MTRNVEEAIAQAFADVPSPGDERLTTYVAGEPVEDTAPYQGRTWDELDHEFLTRHHYALSWFTPGAFHYYLPAFLTAGLEEPKAVYVVSLLMFLKPTDDPTLSTFRRERWTLLSDAQIQALAEWLEWFVEHSGPNARGEFEDALDVVRRRYWW